MSLLLGRETKGNFARHFQSLLGVLRKDILQNVSHIDGKWLFEIKLGRLLSLIGDIRNKIRQSSISLVSLSGSTIAASFQTSGLSIDSPGTVSYLHAIVPSYLNKCIVSAKLR